jgi:hypothetical protein
VVCLEGHPSFTPLITNQGNAGYALAPV